VSPSSHAAFGAAPERQRHAGGRSPRRRRPNAEDRHYLFAGLIRCEICGKGLEGNPVGKRLYYRCRFHRSSANTPRHPNCQISEQMVAVLLDAAAATAEREVAEGALRDLQREQPAIDEAAIRSMLDALGAARYAMIRADRPTRKTLYASLGLTLRFDPITRTLHASQDPARTLGKSWGYGSVGGGT
jgi:hypothetical protein